MTTPTAQKKSLRELRESTGTLFARNNTIKKITCNSEQASFELDAKGGPNSITYVPKECLNQPGFLRLWAKGSITISDDEDMESELTLLAGGAVDYAPKIYTERHSLAEGVVKGEIDPIYTESPQSRDFVINDNSGQFQNNSRYADVAQQARGYHASAPECVFCKAPVFIQQKFLDEGEAPLCGDHADRKGEVASTPQPDGTWHHQVIAIQPVQKSNLPAGG